MDIELNIIITAVIANAILGILIRLNVKDSLSGRYLLWAIFGLTGWVISNYLSNLMLSHEAILWYNRLIFFTTTVMGWSFAMFSTVFPRDVKPSRKFRIFLLIMLHLTMLVSLTPLLVKEVIPSDYVSEIEFGPGINLYSIFLVGCLVYATLAPIFKYRREHDVQVRKVMRLLIFGIGIFAFGATTTNLLMPTVFNYYALTPITPLYTTVFIAVVFWGIIKYQFLNVKIIATELLTFFIWGVMAVQTLIAGSLYSFIFNAGTLLLVMIFGILLIKSVRWEVARKEELQVMTDKLSVANEKLKQLDRAKTEFLSIASHQLRTPLSAIKGFVSLLMEGTYGRVTKGNRPVLEKVYLSNERLITLVEDLLNISRIESGRLNFNFKKNEISPLLEDIVETMQIAAKGKNLSLTYVPPTEEIPQFFFDKDKLREVINNIIDNAIKYTKSGGVTVEIEREDESGQDAGRNLYIIISDTGMGIERGDERYIFEKFQRGKDSTKVFTDGVGLGLYVAEKIIHAHDGRIWAESEGLGKGSTFYIQLRMDFIPPEERPNTPQICHPIQCLVQPPEGDEPAPVKPIRRRRKKVIDAQAV